MTTSIPRVEVSWELGGAKQGVKARVIIGVLLKRNSMGILNQICGQSSSRLSGGRVAGQIIWRISQGIAMSIVGLGLLRCRRPNSIIGSKILKVVTAILI